jgi:hypothetical protein
MQPLQLGTMHVIARVVAEAAEGRTLANLRALTH